MPNFNNLSGKTFGNLTVLNNYESRINETTNNKKKVVFWECKCDCGNTGFFRADTLVSGNTKSCGCIKKSGLKGNYKHGGTHTRLYGIWSKIKARCESKSSPRYSQYGGRGIEMYQEWRIDFPVFEKWALENGYKEDLTIDRIDNNKGYYPENCRWVDYFVQANNKSNNRVIEIIGVAKTLVQWSRFIGMDYKLLHCQLKRGKTLEEILAKNKIEI